MKANYKASLRELRRVSEYRENRFTDLRRKLLAFGVLGMVSFVTAFLFYAWHFQASVSLKQEVWGLFGDFFGGLLNPIFGLLGFLALLWTIYLQSSEQDRSTNALERQARESVQQRFESSFFRLLDMHVAIVNDLDLRNAESDEIICTGRDVLFDLYTVLTDAREDLKGLGEQGYVVELDVAYQALYEEYEHNLAHYFRNFYHIIRFVDDASGDIDRLFYIRVARAQLSSYELTMMFYNGLSKYGNRKMKPLLEKYAMLQNINADKLVWPEVDVLRYEKSVYDDNESVLQLYQLNSQQGR